MTDGAPNESFFRVITTATFCGIKAAVPAKIILQTAADTKHDIYPKMSDYQTLSHSRIARAFYLVPRNDTSDTHTSSVNHDYVPIIIMSVIVVVIVVALLLLA